LHRFQDIIIRPIIKITMIIIIKYTHVAQDRTVQQNCRLFSPRGCKQRWIQKWSTGVKGVGRWIPQQGPGEQMMGVRSDSLDEYFTYLTVTLSAISRTKRSEKLGSQERMYPIISRIHHLLQKTLNSASTLLEHSLLYAPFSICKGLSRLSDQGRMVAMSSASRRNKFCKCANVGLAYVLHSIDCDVRY